MTPGALSAGSSDNTSVAGRASSPVASSAGRGADPSTDASAEGRRSVPAGAASVVPPFGRMVGGAGAAVPPVGWRTGPSARAPSDSAPVVSAAAGVGAVRGAGAGPGPARAEGAAVRETSSADALASGGRTALVRARSSAHSDV